MLKITIDSIKHLKFDKKVLMNLNHKSFWYIDFLFPWQSLIFQQTFWLLLESLVDWK